MAAQQGIFHINLLPKDSFVFTPLGKFLAWATTTGRVLVVLTEFVVLLAFGSRFYFDKKVNDLTEEIDQKQNQIQAFEEPETQIRKILNKQIPISNFLNNNIGFTSKYDNLSRAIPVGVSLTKLQLDATGMTLTGEADSELVFAQFLRNLRNMQGLAKISMKDTSFDQITGAVRFTIQTSFTENG